MPRTPQRYRILSMAHECAQRGDGFTRMDAAYVVGCFELASRIGELEDEGCTFTRKRTSVKNRYGDPVSVTVYRLTHAPPAARKRAGIPIDHPIRPAQHRLAPF